MIFTWMEAKKILLRLREIILQEKKMSLLRHFISFFFFFFFFNFILLFYILFLFSFNINFFDDFC